MEKGEVAGLVTAGVLSSSEGSANKPRTITMSRRLATLSAMAEVRESSISIFLEAGPQLSGIQYGYNTATPLTWHPTDESEIGRRYTGIFSGNDHVVSAILVKGMERQGLLGILGDDTIIKKTGISNNQVEASSGATGGTAEYVRGTNVVITGRDSKTGSLSEYEVFFGGCVGLANSNSGLIMDGCYDEGDISVPGRQIIGGIIGYVPSGNARRMVIQNRMNKGKTEGLSYVDGVIETTAFGATTTTGC